MLRAGSRDTSRPDLRSEKSSGWSWPHLVKVQSKQPSRASSVRTSRRRRSSGSEKEPDPRLIPLPPSPERHRNQSPGDSGSCCSCSSASNPDDHHSLEDLKSPEEDKEREKALSGNMDESIKAIAGIDKWNKKVSVAILITFWEKVDEEKKHASVANDAEHVESGSDSPNQSTPSNPRSEMSLDDIALEVKYEDSGVDEGDETERDEANFHSQHSEGQSQRSHELDEERSTHMHESESHEAGTSIPESYLTAPEMKEASSEEPVGMGGGEEEEVVVAGIPGSPPHQDVDLDANGRRSSSLIVEDQSLQDNDESATPTRLSQTSLVHDGEDDVHLVNQPESEAPEGPAIERQEVSTAAEQGTVMAGLPRSKSSSESSSTSGYAVLGPTNIDLEPPSDSAPADQDAAIAGFTRSESCSRCSSVGWESPREGVPTSVDPEPSSEEGYFDPRVPSFYMATLAPGSPPTVQTERALESHQHSLEDEIETQDIGESSWQGLKDLVDDSTPEPEGDSLAEKALAVATPSIEDTVSMLLMTEDGGLVSNFKSPARVTETEGLGTIATPSPEPPLVVHVSEETVIKIVKKEPNERLPTPIIRIQAATDDNLPTPSHFRERIEESLESAESNRPSEDLAIELALQTNRSGNLQNEEMEVESPPSGIATSPPLNAKPSTTFICTVDGQKKRKRRLFFCKTRNLAMRKHLLYLLIGKGLAGQAKPVLQQLAKGECAIVGDMEVHAHG